MTILSTYNRFHRICWTDFSAKVLKLPNTLRCGFLRVRFLWVRYHRSGASPWISSLSKKLISLTSNSKGSACASYHGFQNQSIYGILDFPCLRVYRQAAIISSSFFACRGFMMYVSLCCEPKSCPHTAFTCHELLYSRFVQDLRKILNSSNDRSF